MKRHLILILPALLCAVSCQQTKSPFDRDVANYALVDIEVPDLSGITDNGKEVRSSVLTPRSTTVPGTA